MAEEQGERSREDLTEEASPFRVEEYRRKGIVAQSKELNGLIALIAAGVATYVIAPSVGSEITDFMREVFRSDLMSRADIGTTQRVGAILYKALHLMITLGLPVCAAGFVLAVFSSIVQTGPIFSFEPLTPDFNKINPIEGLKRLVSSKQIIDGVRLLLKMSAILVASYLMVKSELIRAVTQIYAEPGGILVGLGAASKTLFTTLVLILLAFAGVDFGLQRFEFSKNLRMTKQEAKQEFKEREGDPQIKARIRSVQREMARKRMMAAVKKADVIVTNPTHIAIALMYDREAMGAPKVVAKGADFVAQKIKEIAREAGIPLVENVTLARTLYKSVKLGQSIPRNLYQAVAEVLAYVYRLKQRRG